MDPWGFCAEERQGNARFLACQAVNLSSKAAGRLEYEDEIYLNSFPDVFQKSSFEEEYKSEQDHITLLSAHTIQMHSGFVPSKKRSMSKVCTRSSDIDLDIPFGLMAPNSPLQSPGFFPGIRTRRSASCRQNSETSIDIKPTSNDVDHFPVIHFRNDAPVSTDDPTQIPSNICVDRRKSSTSTHTVSTVSSVDHSLNGQNRRGSRTNIVRASNYSKCSRRQPPRIYGSSSCVGRAGSFDGSETVASNSSSSSVDSGWSGQSTWHTAKGWDFRYQKSPYDVPVNSHLSSDSRTFDGPQNCDSPLLILDSPHETTQSILSKSRLYCV